jgi:hypothetical protein
MSIISVLPSEFTNLLNASERLSGVTRRKEVYANAQSTVVNPNQPIKFFIANDGETVANDYKDSTVNFFAPGVISSGTGTFCSYSQPTGITCIFNKLEVQYGSVQVIQVLNYNLLFAMWLMSQPINTWLTTYNITMGCASTQTQANADFLNAAKWYSVPIGKICELLDVTWPSGLVKDQLQINLYLEQASNCIQTDYTGQNATYSVVNAQFHYSELELSPALGAMLREKRDSTGISIPYSTYGNYETNGINGSTSIQNVLPFSYQRFTGMLCVARNSALVNLQSTVNKLGAFELYNQLQSTKLKINNQYYPNDKCYGPIELYNHFLESYDIDFNKDTYAGSSWTTQMQINLSCAQFQNHLVVDNNMITGLDVSTSSSTLIHEMVTTGLPNTVLFDYYAQYIAMVVIGKGGSITLIE